MIKKLINILTYHDSEPTEVLQGLIWFIFAPIVLEAEFFPNLWYVAIISMLIGYGTLHAVVYSSLERRRLFGYGYGLMAIIFVVIHFTADVNWTPMNWGWVVIAISALSNIRRITQKIESKNSDRAARPCPGGTGSFLQGATKVRCLYSKTDDAGLKLIQVIREELKNDMTRIVLRTGQPGQAPERDVIINYDINDYKSKTELTAQKLFTVIIATLRSYRDINLIEEKPVFNVFPKGNDKKLIEISIRKLSDDIRRNINFHQSFVYTYK